MKGSLWSPRWILSHLLVLALVVVMVNLGLWQLRRLDERRDDNRLIEGRMAAAAAPLDEVVDASADEAAFRRVLLTGEFDPEGEVFVANRSLDGQPGSWVLTPLVRSDGSSVVVNRGFLPRAVVLDPTLVDFAPPTGDVDVEGLIQHSATGGDVGTTGAGETPELSVADVDLMAQTTGRTLEPVIVQAVTIDPSTAELPLPIPPPELSEGPHMGYAAQWFIFATIGVVGYGLILRRVSRGDESRGDVAPDWDL